MIELRRTGETHRVKNIVSSMKQLAHVKMTWETGVDLDLHAFAIDSEDEFVHVYYLDKTSYCKNIRLDFDAGVGNTPGRNEENLIVNNISKVRKIIFVANIFRFFGNLFSSNEQFSKYDGKIHISAFNENISVSLNSTQKGRWAVIAMINNENGYTNFKNINAILKYEPDINYLMNLH